MKKLIGILIILGLSVSLVGCDNMNKQDAGVIGGGLVGGLVGSRFGGGNGNVLATVGGAIAGAAIGGLIGRSMDKTDQLEMQKTLEDSRTGRTTTWHNPDNGNTYHMRPTKTYKSKRGAPCREYHMDAMIGGKKQQVWGHACRQQDGSWKIEK